MHVTAFVTKKHFGAAYWEIFPSLSDKPYPAVRLWGLVDSEGNLKPETLTCRWASLGEVTSGEAYKLSLALAQASTDMEVLAARTIQQVFGAQLSGPEAEETDSIAEVCNG